MRKEQILGLDGRELDATVANHLLPSGKARMPNYSTDLNAVRQAEDEIERRGLERRYSSIVARMVNEDAPAGYQWWAILRASAEVRSRAILLTLSKDLP